MALPTIWRRGRGENEKESVYDQGVSAKGGSDAVEFVLRGLVGDHEHSVERGTLCVDALSFAVAHSHGVGEWEWRWTGNE